MSRFAIFVTVKVKPGCAERFEPLILENAQAALRDEPECHLFHVMRSTSDSDVFHFYEVYSTEASLETHRNQPHFKRYSQATIDLIAERSVQPVTVINPENIEVKLT